MTTQDVEADGLLQVRGPDSQQVSASIFRSDSAIPWSNAGLSMSLRSLGDSSIAAWARRGGCLSFLEHP